jgi:hypothetical protein
MKSSLLKYKKHICVAVFIGLLVPSYLAFTVPVPAAIKNMSWYDKVKYTLYTMLLVGGYYAIKPDAQSAIPTMVRRQDPRALPEWRLKTVEQAFFSDNQIPQKSGIVSDYARVVQDFLNNRYPDNPRLARQIGLRPNELEWLLRGTLTDQEIIDLQIILYNHKANYYLGFIHGYGENRTKEWLLSMHIDPSLKIQ